MQQTHKGALNLSILLICSLNRPHSRFKVIFVDTSNHVTEDTNKARESSLIENGGKLREVKMLQLWFNSDSYFDSKTLGLFSNVFIQAVMSDSSPSRRHPFNAQLISNNHVTSPDHWQDVRLVQFDIKGSGIRY